MGALLSLPITLLNFLLPFTRPGTPIIQDLIHTAILCGTLYFAPQIAEWYNHQNHTITLREPPEHGAPLAPNPPAENVVDGEREAEFEGIPVDERLVLQDDDEDALPPPHAPTPPHAQNLQQPPLPQAIDDPHMNGDAQAGPANPGPEHPRATPANRTIGAKKAKSLARKDQRRAYHEFHRQEAELRRLQDQEGREEREAAAQLERQRRKEIEESIIKKEREEREARKREMERDAEDEIERRDRVVWIVRDVVGRHGAVDLVDVAWKEGKDKEWVEKLVRASGVLEKMQREGVRLMITKDGWLVRIDGSIMEKAYAEAEAFGKKNGGKISFEDLGGFMEKAVLARTKV